MEAQYNLGIMYHNGRGIKQDIDKAVQMYKLAAEQGYSNAQYNLAYMLYHGHCVDKNEREAISWYQRAANPGHA